jgi:hypothetical protein
MMMSRRQTPHPAGSECTEHPRLYRPVLNPVAWAVLFIAQRSWEEELPSAILTATAGLISSLAPLNE